MERLNIVYECINRCVRLQSYLLTGDWIAWVNKRRRLWLLSSHLDGTSVVNNKGFIVWPNNRFFFKEMEGERQVHFTYSLGPCSQSEPRIRFFFPARRPAIHLDSRLRKRSNVKMKLKISHNRKQGDISVQNNSYAWTGVKLSYFFVGGKGDLSW